jgi:hypothetical protein
MAEFRAVNQLLGYWGGQDRWFAAQFEPLTSKAQEHTRQAAVQFIKLCFGLD